MHTVSRLAWPSPRRLLFRPHRACWISFASGSDICITAYAPSRRMSIGFVRTCGSMACATPQAWALRRYRPFSRGWLANGRCRYPRIGRRGRPCCSCTSRYSGTHTVLARLLYATGLRIAEALQLRTKDLDFERRGDRRSRRQGQQGRGGDAAAPLSRHLPENRNSNAAATATPAPASRRRPRAAARPASAR